MTSKGVTIALLALLLGCSPSPEKLLSEAEAELSEGAYDQAAVLADRGLTQQPARPATRWRLELVALEARARAGNAAATIAALERLAGEQDTQITPSHYISTADQLRAAGDAKGAVELLDRAARRYPADTKVKKTIAQIKAKGSDAELEALRSLGYLD
jgi:hypothetical protein